MVLLHNRSCQGIEFEVGDRVAQLALEKIQTSGSRIVQDLSPTDRGGQGFGSTGLSHTRTFETRLLPERTGLRRLRMLRVVEEGDDSEWELVDGETRMARRRRAAMNAILGPRPAASKGDGKGDGNELVDGEEPLRMTGFSPMTPSSTMTPSSPTLDGPTTSLSMSSIGGGTVEEPLSSSATRNGEEFLGTYMGARGESLDIFEKIYLTEEIRNQVLMEPVGLLSGRNSTTRRMVLPCACTERAVKRCTTTGEMKVVFGINGGL